MHSAARNPDQLPKGAVLIVGVGSSGVQIAEALLQGDRRTCFSVGPRERPARPEWPGARRFVASCRLAV